MIVLNGREFYLDGYSLIKLNCGENKITNLDNLPKSLIMLNSVKVVKK